MPQCAGFDYNAVKGPYPDKTSILNFKKGCTAALPPASCARLAGPRGVPPNFIVLRRRYCAHAIRMYEDLAEHPPGEKQDLLFSGENDTEPSPAHFVGCFARNADTAACDRPELCPRLGGAAVLGSGLTVQECATMCRGHPASSRARETPAIIMFSPNPKTPGVCHCGDVGSLRGQTALQVHDKNCGRPCKGEGEHPVHAHCGGQAYGAMYALEDPRVLASTEYGFTPTLNRPVAFWRRPRLTGTSSSSSMQAVVFGSAFFAVLGFALVAAAHGLEQGQQIGRSHGGRATASTRPREVRTETGAGPRLL